MTESKAIELAKAHADTWGVPWVQIKKIKKDRDWWYFSVAWYNFEIDTGDGEAFAIIDSQTATVNRFEYYPREKKFLLPLWAAYPTYNSVTSGWRQGYGEEYKYEWHSFYQSMSEDDRAEYKRKFPPPDDEELCWHGFYELIADTPADDKHSVAEFIIGRVPEGS